MHFGTADRRKADVAEGAALVVGRFVARRSDRLGVIAFGGDGPETGSRRRPAVGTGCRAPARRLAHRPARRGRRRDVDGPRPAHRGRVADDAPGSSTIVSDFRGPLDWRPALTAVAGRHTVLAIEIVDPREDELVDVGELTLIDPETGRTLRVDTGDRRLAQAFDEAAARRTRDAVAAEFKRLGIRHLRLTTEGSWLAALARGLDHDWTTDMTFLAPLLLLGLLLVPVLLGLYVWVQRRRTALRGPLHEPGPAGQPRADADRRWRRHVPPALYLGAIAALALGARTPDDGRRRPRARTRRSSWPSTSPAR